VEHTVTHLGRLGRRWRLPGPRKRVCFSLGVTERPSQPNDTGFDSSPLMLIGLHRQALLEIGKSLRQLSQLFMDQRQVVNEVLAVWIELTSLLELFDRRSIAPLAVAFERNLEMLTRLVELAWARCRIAGRPSGRVRRRFRCFLYGLVVWRAGGGGGRLCRRCRSAPKQPRTEHDQARAESPCSRTAKRHRTGSIA